MRIISVTVRNCRIHGDKKVELDPSRTLIGGNNETGKSTLIEALHRAFFLKAKGNTEQHRALISNLHPGAPEVCVEFVACGQTYVLKKRFGGNGSTTLSSSGQAPLSGDPAEAELARVLRCDAGLSGRAMLSQWAHLWVWQGDACRNPSEHATSQSDGLLRRLRESGGAGVAQSDLDIRLVKHFANLKEQLFTQSGKPKAHSELEKAQTAEAEAMAAVQVCCERVRNLEEAASQLELGQRELASADALLVTLREEQQTLDERARKLSQLQEVHRTHTTTAGDAALKCHALEQANQDIFAKRRTIEANQAELGPKNERLKELEGAKEVARNNLGLAEASFTEATDKTRIARVKHELALACINLNERLAAHTIIQRKAERIATAEAAVSEAERQLAALPQLEKSGLANIQEQERAEAEARTALQAMAAGLEVVEAGQPVTVEGSPLGSGQKQILTSDAEVRIDKDVVLRIQPGGGTSLAQARRALDEATAKLRQSLDGFGFRSAQDAVETFASREDLKSRIKALRAELRGLGSETIPGELKESERQVAAARGNVERLSTLVPGFAEVSTSSPITTPTPQLEAELNASERVEIQRKADRDRAAQVFSSAEQALGEFSKSVQALREQLAGLTAQLSLLVAQHGDDYVRGSALLAAQAAKQQADSLVAAVSTQISELQPDLLPADMDRVKRATMEQTNKSKHASNQVAAARAMLRSDGSEDPRASLVSAEAKLRQATEHREKALRRAEAIALLAQLFMEEQKQLADQLTAPLAEKVSGYLQCIFGPGTRAVIELRENSFTGLRLYRADYGGAAYDFDTLSGGAREQTAAAVRLALAEVLAADHDGCLPVVFDDAFVYSDPDRVKRLQRMLDLAACRGLQVVVLTCNPNDYVMLGAKTVTLQEQAGGARPAPAPMALAATDPAMSPEDSTVVTEELRKALTAALSASGGSKGNQALRQELGWDEGTYSKVRNDLLEQGRISLGKGRGGSVSLTDI